MKIVNKQETDILGWEDLTDSERAEFDYLDTVETYAAQFFRYRGETYDIGEFMRLPHTLDWEGVFTLHAYAAIVVRLLPLHGTVIAAEARF